MEENNNTSKSDSRNEPIESCYVNRELSWLEFNQRVLMEASDRTVPLLERLKFLMIYQSNMEEFFRVRVGILTHQAKLAPERKDPVSGWTAAEQIDQIILKVNQQQTVAESVWKNLKGKFKEDGIDIVDFRKTSKVDELMCKKHFIGFRHLLVPKIVESNRPLPFLWGQEDYVVAFLGPPSAPKIAVIPMFRLPAYTAFELDGRDKIVLNTRLVRQFVPNLLKKEEIRETAAVRITRNADVFIEEHPEDFRDEMKKMLKKCKREMPVRAQVYGKISAASRSLLAKKLGLPESLVFTTNVPFDLSFRSAVPPKPGYRYEERRSAREIGLRKGEYFKYLEQDDILLSFPFQNMTPFIDLLLEAVDDPDVLSIKITLYRLSISSKVAAALAYAAEKGKDVLCLLELRARFDEQSNIDYSEMLEDAGCQVIYGLPEKKVHSKLCLITRTVDGNIRHITQIGTGNYNEFTSEQYTDLSLITSDEDVAKDAEAVFRALEKGEIPSETDSLWIAPKSFETRLIRMMDREIEKRDNGRICIKVNSMNNLEIMKKLIECSRAGVSVELFIRGICCLKPGIPGMTDHISVKSVVGRWLEHSRIFCFGAGEDERIFIGSGDLLNRNLERRVEAFAEVKTEDTKNQVREVLNAFRDDKEKARIMLPDGSYLREKGGEGTSSQERLYRYFSEKKVKLSVGGRPEADAPMTETPAVTPAEQTERLTTEMVPEEAPVTENETEVPEKTPVSETAAPAAVSVRAFFRRLFRKK